MTPEELEVWAEDFEAFHARFAHLFARSEPREQAAKYLRGLLAPIPRKNGWQVAEAVGDATPDRTQQGRPAGRPCFSTGPDGMRMPPAMNSRPSSLKRWAIPKASGWWTKPAS